MKSFAAVCGAALLLVSQEAGARETYVFDSAHSLVTFSVHQFLNTTKGRFRQASGTIEIDREHPENSSVVARIEVKSIDTGIRKRDDHLRSPDFFNVAQFPDITFQSERITQTDAVSAEVIGNLTMHGVTKPVVLHVKLLTPMKGGETPERARWLITTEPLKRRDFDLHFSKASETISGISQEVTVKLEIESVKK